MRPVRESTDAVAGCPLFVRLECGVIGNVISAARAVGQLRFD
jgi:hypothetical protein